MPKHGEERNKKLVTKCGKTETLMVGDRVVYEGPLHFYQISAGFRPTDTPGG